MGQKNADGPSASSGHRFGFRAASAAGVPWGWALRQKSPAQQEHDAKQAEEEKLVVELVAKYPALASFRVSDQYGKVNPGWWLVKNRAFCEAVAREESLAGTRGEAERQKARRKALLNAAVASGKWRP